MQRAIAEKLRTIDRLLEKEYGLPTRKRADPLDVLIGTVLSQNTSAANSGRAYRAMREAFPTWNDVMNAPQAALEKVLKPGGLARTKSARIQRMLRSIAEHGPLELDYLRELPAEEAENALLAFDGVGPKTARCVLLFGLEREAFPVDTHILRIFRRLGIIPSDMTAEKAHAYLLHLIPKGRCHPLHLNLIAHGRRVCHPREPDCNRCALERHCAYDNSEGTAQ